MDHVAGEHFGAGGDDNEPQMISGINVTPLVDITLVLLIIFMVTATVIVNAGIKVELPKAASGTDQTKTTLALTLMKDGTLYLNGEKTTDQAVTRYVSDTLTRSPDLQAIIAADRVVPHGDVVHVIDLVKRAGVRRFAINVDPSSATGAK
jgi:biopolymer transport protein ExbD